MANPLDAVFAALASESNTRLLLLDNASLVIKSVGDIPTDIPWRTLVVEGQVVSATVNDRRYLVHQRNGFTLVQSDAESASSA